ncbi:MAG: hypothetical protein LQ346_008945 [Caloplaca aetnensis]|nr:MAG: hypothetical protein LQ346_008945 [Caloplaca aetnensis]
MSFGVLHQQWDQHWKSFAVSADILAKTFDDLQASMAEEAKAPDVEVKGTFVPPPEPAGPFPFMKLPAELRIMVYKYHFNDHTYRMGQCSCHNKKECAERHTGRHLTYRHTRGVRPDLLRVSKAMYHEVMPLFFSNRLFSFEKIEDLGGFLAQIGPYNRQYITRIEFEYEKNGATNIFDIHEAFRLLGECPNLSQLCIYIGAHHLWRKSAFPGLATLRKIRGIEDLKLVFGEAYWVTYLYGEEFGPTKEALAKRFDVLTGPYSPAEIKRREANGITKCAEPRMVFGEKKPESRAARVERRQKLQEIV